MTSLALRALPVVLLQLALLGTFADPPDESPTVDDLRMIFNSLTRKFPARSLIECYTTISEPGWSEDQVRKELQRQEAFMKKDDQELTSDQRATLRETRLKAIRQSNGGLKELKQREWRSSGLYRLDQLDFSAEITPWHSAEEYRTSFINFGRPGFSRYSRGMVDYILSSITLDTRERQRWEEAPFSKAFIIEPEIALPIISATVRRASIDVSKIDVDLSTLNFDEKAAARLVGGANEAWEVTLRRQPANSATMRFIGKSKGVADKLLLELNYQPLNDGTCLLYSGLMTNQSNATYYLTTRSAFDTNRFPRGWIRETRDVQGKAKRVVMKFGSVQWNPTFDDNIVFLTKYPTNYIVAEIDKKGNATILQNPSRARHVLEFHRPLSRTLAYYIAIILLICLPLLIAVKRRITRR